MSEVNLLQVGKWLQWSISSGGQVGVSQTAPLILYGGQQQLTDLVALCYISFMRGCLAGLKVLTLVLLNSDLAAD